MVFPVDSEVEEEEPDFYQGMRRTSSDSSSLLIQNNGPQMTINNAYDAFLEKKGISLPMIAIILCSGIGLISDTLEIMSLSFAKDQLTTHFKLSRQEESTLSGALFAGMLLGGLFWGRAADIYGRRRVLLISLTMNGSCAALSALSPTFWLFLVARFFSGIGVGGSLPVIFSYVSEWVPRRIKGGVISTVATCWMVGSVLAAALAWLFLPMTIDNPFWNSWRVYLVTCSIPSLIASAMYCYLDESPVFLIEKGRMVEAMLVLRNYAGNSAVMSAELSTLKRAIEDDAALRPNNPEKFNLFVVIWDFLRGTFDLFTPPLLKTTLLLMVVILPVHFGYYGFMMWLPEYIQTHGSNSSGTIRPTDYVYRESLYVSLASLPGNLITILITDKVGPKIILCVSQVLSAGSVFLLWKFNTPDQTIILSCVFNAVTAPIFNMVDFLIPALYPTPARGTAFGFHTSLIRIIMIAANWLFSLFIDTSPTVPILITAVLLVTSALISLFVPKISTKHL